MNAKPLLLIAEDDPLIIATLEMLLTGEGYEVLTATDGQVALDLLLAGAKPALILSDIRMPNKNGYELLLPSPETKNPFSTKGKRVTNWRDGRDSNPRPSA